MRGRAPVMVAALLASVAGLPGVGCRPKLSLGGAPPCAMGFDDVAEHGRVAMQTVRQLAPIDGVEDACANPARSEFFNERAKIIGGECG